MARNSMLDKLICVALVTCVVYPAGQIVFPYVADVVDALPFNAVEAMVSATLGFSLHGALFG